MVDDASDSDDTNESTFTLKPVRWSNEPNQFDDFDKVRKGPTRRRSASLGTPAMTTNEAIKRLAFVNEGREKVKMTREKADKVEKQIDAIERRTPGPKEFVRDVPPHMMAKGKGADPRNWGGVELSDGEVSEGEQAVRYAKIKSLQEGNEKRIEGRLSSDAHQKIKEIIDPVPSAHRSASNPVNPVDNPVVLKAKRQDMVAFDGMNDQQAVNQEISDGKGGTDEEESRRRLLQLKEEMRMLKSKLTKKKNQGGEDKVPRQERSSAEPMSFQMNDLIGRAASVGIGARQTPLKSSERMEEHTFIGKAFADVDVNYHKRHQDPPSDPESSESSSDDDDGGGGGNQGGNRRRHEDPEPRGDDGGGYDGMDQRDGGGYARVKPTAPEKYDGSADTIKFYQFVNQGSRYLKRGRVPEWDQIPELSNYLKGKAYEFYLNEVSMEVEQWDVPSFFRELFNACFPPNFRMDQQRKLETFEQGSLTVREYAAKLKMFYRIVGYAHKREKVRKLWRGFVPRIRQRLYEIGMDPERSGWGEVVASAENLEIARAMGEDFKRRNDRGDRDGGRTTSVNSTSFPRENRRDQGYRNNTDTRRDNRNYTSNRNTSGNSNNNNNNGQRKRLTEAEMARYRREGRCFGCSEIGHIGKHCPHATHVTARGNGNRPPGVRSNNIEYDDEVERLRDASMADEGGVSSAGIQLRIAAMFLDTVEVRQVPSGRPRWRRTRKSHNELRAGRIVSLIDIEEEDINFENPGRRALTRDPYATRVEALLHSQQPFPGDELFKKREGRRFMLLRVSDTEYVLFDDKRGSECILEDWLVTTDDYPVALHYAKTLANAHELSTVPKRWKKQRPVGNLYPNMIAYLLEFGRDMYEDGFRETKKKPVRFEVKRVWLDKEVVSYRVYDKHLDVTTFLDTKVAHKENIDLRGWYEKRIVREGRRLRNLLCDALDASGLELVDGIEGGGSEYYDRSGAFSYLEQALEQADVVMEGARSLNDLQLHAVRPKAQMDDNDSRRYIERNASRPKDPSRMIPDPIVVVVKLNGSPVRALLDSGSLGDFVSTSIVTQLNLKKEELTTPLSVLMAAQGSKSKVNYGVNVRFEYQGINEVRKFDVMNLSGYDMILGTPWFYQHRAMIGLNPTRVVIGSSESLKMSGSGVQKLASRLAKLYEEKLDDVRKNLMDYAKPICKKAAESPLPPLRAINHEIPIIDEEKVYSHCGNRPKIPMITA